METIQTQPDYPKGATFETVWAALQEIAKRQEEFAKQQKETERILKESDERQKVFAEQQLREAAERQRKADKWQREFAEQQAREAAERQRKADERQREADKRQKEADKRQKEVNEQQAKEEAERKKKYDREMEVLNKRFGEFSNRFGEVVEYMVAPGLKEKFSEMGLILPVSIRNYEVNDNVNQVFFEVDILLENGDQAMLVEVKSKLTTRDVKDHIKRLEKMRLYANSRGDKRMFLGAVAGVVMTPETKKYAMNQGFYVVEPSGESFQITPPNGQAKEW
jgi:hypothetical protein